MATYYKAASATGNLSVVRSLFAAGAEVSTQSGYFGTGLQAVAFSIVTEVTRFLLDAGANINAQGR
jgi:hypothetical protein